MRFLRVGSSGVDVRFLQERLRALGFSPGAVDSEFGPRTDQAVRQFQAAHALRVDGVVGPRTWDLLRVTKSASPPDDVIASQRLWMRGRVPAGLSPARAAVLDAAISTLGWVERPWGSNGGPDVDRISSGYYSPSDEARLGKPPWCALAVSHWLRAGLRAPSWAGVPFGARFGATSQIDSWWRSQGIADALSNDVSAVPASIFTMSRTPTAGTDAAAAGHCGLVVARVDGRLLTIEGNAANAVKARWRQASEVRRLIPWWLAA